MTMKTSLSHLPIKKASYVKVVASVIVNELKNSKKGLAYVILFGCYARGDWVNKRGYNNKGRLRMFK